MSQKNTQDTSTSLLQIIVITAAISITIGFLAGVGFSNLQSGEKKAPSQFSSPQKIPQKKSLQDQVAAHISVLESEVTNNPDNGTAWTQLGNLCFDNNQVQKAIRAYTKSLEINPNNANVLTDLGVMYRRNKEFKKAVETFKKANEIVPQHEVSLLNTGIVRLYDLKDTAGAVAAWEKLIKLNNNVKISDGQFVRDVLQTISR